MGRSVTRPRAPDGTIPVPPEGYARPYRLDQPWWVLYVVGSVLGLAAIAVGLWLSPFFRTQSTERIGATSLGLVVIAGVVGTIVLHELVHGLVYRYYGYDVSFSAEVLRATFTTAARGQLHARREAVWISIAPLVALTPLSLALIAAPVLELSLVGLLLLVLNTSGSVADLSLVVTLRSLPAETLLCDGDATYVYEPLAAQTAEALRARR